MQARKRYLLASALLSLPVGAAENPFKQILKGVKSQLAGTNTIIGTVEVMSPFVGVVTCFKDTPGGAISRRPILSLSEAEAFPSLIVTKAGVMSSAACAELQKNGLLVLASDGGAATSAGRPADFKAFADTELKGIFERNPQPGGGKWTDWPRVVITLVAAPTWGWDKLNRHRFKFPSFACWTFRAKVWDSPKVSRVIPAFHHCSDMPTKGLGGDANMIYQNWSGINLGSLTMNTRGSTGIKRTEGPNWPDTPLPVGNMDTAAKVNIVTFNGLIIYNIIGESGLDFRLEDHRLWVNLAPEFGLK
jgi:hypothetical protein